MKLEVRLHHRFPETSINIDFSVPSPGITVLFGPSGSGKSTVITAAAGLWHPDDCRISVDNEVVVDTSIGIWMPPERRSVGLVFQDARLFPHMSVTSNLTFGMRRTRERRIGFDEVVDLLGIRALLPRRPSTLSGGERQRVAIGRALLRQPRVLLMDEPLASLDAARKAEILPFLTRLKTMLKLPILYVTHAMDELLQLADYVVLLESGSVLASGPVAELSARADLPLARRDDSGAVLSCRVTGHDMVRQLTSLAWGPATLAVPITDIPVGTEVRVRVPAREVILARPELDGLQDALSLHNILPGIVRTIGDDPGRRAALVEIACGGGSLLSRVTPDAVTRLGLVPGAPIKALMKSMSVEVLGQPRAADSNLGP